MYRVTRELIRDRGSRCDVPPELIDVRHEPTGTPNDCLKNAFAAAADSTSDFLPVAGWLILPYEKSTDRTECIQHWWCVDEKSNTYSDFTPLLFEGKKAVDYVIDPSLTMYAHDYRDNLKSMVGKCLLRTCGKWYAVWEQDDGTEHTDPLDTLDTELLFTHLNP